MTEPLRLLLVNPSAARGGAEEMILGFAIGSERVRTTVACLQPGGFTDDLLEAGVNVKQIDGKRLRNPRAWAATVARLARLARKADVVVGWQVKGHYYATPAARLARRPVAWWDHGIRPARKEPRHGIDARLPASLHADLVITSSWAAATRHAHARAIHPGIDMTPFAAPDRAEARARLGLADGERGVGIVGRLQPWKGQHRLLEAAPAILSADPNARIIVIGGTPGGFSAGYPAALEAQADRLGIAAQVRFLEQRRDVATLLPGLDVFVNASDAEPFGLVTVEAMAAGLPVVGTGAGGTPEILADGRTGLLVPADDVAALAHAVIRLLTDGPFADSIAAAARVEAFERFSMARYVRDFESLLFEMAGRTP